VFRGRHNKHLLGPHMQPSARCMFHFTTRSLECLAISAVDVAVFILDANPLAPSRPVKITITVPVIFTAIPVATIPVSISIMSASVAIPFPNAAISIPFAISIPVLSLPFVRPLCLLLLWFRRVLSGGSLGEAGGYPAHQKS
jgi:hypothetical protein